MELLVIRIKMPFNDTDPERVKERNNMLNIDNSVVWNF